jgi:hypothetical protein
MFDVSTAVVHENFAAFKSTTSDEGLLVESYDNKEFEVFRGTMANMKKVGVITAVTDAELVAKLNALVNPTE